MERKEILEENIKANRDAIDEAKAELAKLKTTYRNGDRFTLDGSNGVEKRMLVEVGFNRVGLLNMGCGAIIGYKTIQVNNCLDITQSEYNKLVASLGNCSYTRYWDNSKQLRV